jgi:hypothetical protein
MIEIRHLEHDAHVARDGQPLPVGQREQLVNVQHAVQVLHPLRIHVPVKYNPLALVQLTAHIVDNLAQDVREQSVRPLPGVRVGKKPGFFLNPAQWIFLGFLVFFYYFGFFYIFAQKREF